MDQDPTLTATPPTAEGATATAQPDAPDSGAAATPAEGSDAAASLEFGRNLARVRESRNLDHYQLAALTTQLGEKGRVSADSIKELWGLAQALDVMPIVLGSGSTRGGEAPVPTETLLRKKGGRTTRLQRLVELLTEDGRVSTFAEMVGMDAADVYGVAASEAQLTEEQLEPFLVALPRVRRSWLMSGEGEPLAAGMASAPAVPASAAPLETAAPVTPAAEAPAPPASERGWRNVLTPAPLAAPIVQPLSVAVAAGAGAPMYVPLGLGLVAEVDAVLLSGAGAVRGFRLLAGAGGVPVLTSPDQLEHLFYALRGVLDQGAGE